MLDKRNPLVYRLFVTNVKANQNTRSLLYKPRSRQRSDSCWNKKAVDIVVAFLSGFCPCPLAIHRKMVFYYFYKLPRSWMKKVG